MHTRSLLQSALIAASLFAALALTACRSTPTPPADTPVQSSRVGPGQPMPLTEAAEGRPYDFYLLNLSWSPEYCHSNPGAVECSQHLGFVVHGLWPQNNDGSYPKDCASRPGPSREDAWQGIFPTASLAQHEWIAHGTCTPYSADTYFDLVRRAHASVKIPAEFTEADTPRSQTPDEIASEFLRINPGIPHDGIAISCGHNFLTAVEVCLDKNLHPRACQSIHTCGATSVKIAQK